MKLIDKNKIAAEIERLKGSLSPDFYEYDYDAAKVELLEKIEKFLNTLEVKEEILDEEGKTKLMKKCVHKAYKRGYNMGVLKTINEMNHNIKEVDLEKEFESFLDNIEGVPRMWHSDEQIEWAKDIAKHFFELGLKAEKGELNN